MSAGKLFSLIDDLCALFDQIGLDYAITGSIASAAYAEPYTSIDVDYCIQLQPDKLDALLKVIPPRFYHDADAIRDAAQRNSVIHIMDNLTGLKADLSFLPSTGFLGGVVSRRRKLKYGTMGKEHWTVSPEDVVLMKLLWRKDTRSQKQWDNALSVVRFQGVRLDWPYMHLWADKLELRADLEQLKREAGI